MAYRQCILHTRPRVGIKAYLGQGGHKGIRKAQGRHTVAPRPRRVGILIKLSPGVGNGHIPRVGILYRHSCGQVGHIGISRPKVGI